MFRKVSVRLLSFLLAAVMVVGMFPFGAFAEGYVDTYQKFMSALRVLEDYADEYAAQHPQYASKSALLVINFIRTGVDRYNDGNWKTLAGEEITDFTDYVEKQDFANCTNAMDLRNIEIDEFVLPNGNQVDFGHMFGTLNIAYVASEASADLGGWAGDICDLLLYSHNFGKVPAGTIDEMADYIRENCFGIDAEKAFGMDDFYGDMDAFYLNQMVKKTGKLSTVMAAYFTANLTNADRAAYFLNNRFKGLESKEDVRAAVLGTYTANTGLSVLEADRGLSGLKDLRTACCYAFADYLYDLAGDRLEGGSDEEEEEKDNPYYSVFSSSQSVLAPGISQTINYAMTADNKQMAYYVATVDVTRDDVTIMAGYKDADPSKGWGMQRVTDQVAALAAKHSNPADKENYIENFRPIVATNGAGFNMSTGEPGGLLVMDGREWHPVDGNGFFAILKDGTAMIGTTADYAVYKEQIKEAIAGFGATLVLDGKIVAKNDGGRASRTAIGIKADGSVVMMVLDGRQEPFSCGGTMAEIAQIMLDAGCVHAINLDGGGSTTFASKPEGSDQVVVVNRPSDGYQRSVSTSLIAVSTAKSSDEFDRAIVTSDYDYLTINTQMQLTATGVNNIGGAAVLPQGATWAVSDESIGTVDANGVFTALANGEVEVQLIADGVVVGSKMLYVVVPDGIAFEQDNIRVIFGVPTKIPVEIYFNGNPVAFNEQDVLLALTDAFAGDFDGLYFTASEKAGIRNVMVAAILMTENPEDMQYAMANITAFKADEAYFDFDNATAGNRTLAWLREVNNATQKDEMLYQIIEPDKNMGIAYTFALDMTSIEIPPQLADLTYMLPGADAGSTAWDFLLQLAERVSVLTEVQITVQLDKNLDVDISGMKISNELFELRRVTLDENNQLTIVCGWIDRTQSVDPATVNSTCVLSGLKAVPKAGATWGADNRLIVKNTGTVSYKIFLRASSLYSFANIPENQAKYGLQPYSGDQERFYYQGEPLMYGEKAEAGAYMTNTYVDFEDTIVLDASLLQGWQVEGEDTFYYVDHAPVNDCIMELPGQKDPENKYFYQFDANGICVGKVTGLVELNGGLYYIINGVAQTGWHSIMDANGNVNYYFFNTWSRRAINGKQNIGGYDYLFENYILVRGDLVVNATGMRYMWAGSWVTQQWLEIDGKIAYACSSAYFQTGLVYRYSPEGDWTYYAFDEEGWWMQDYTGIYEWNGGTYLIRDGIVIPYPGLFELNGDYYYISSNNVLVKNCYYWVSKTDGSFPEGRYQFDAEGKLVLPEEKPVEPGTPVEPGRPAEPEKPDVNKNGIFAEDGSLYYYVNGVRNYAGLIYIDGYYYYARTNGEIVNGRTYWISKTNGLLPENQYTFDAQGRMTNSSDAEQKPDEGETVVKSGIVAENGKLYYYENNARTYAGLIYLDGHYYYVRTSGELAVSCNYWITKTNGLLIEKSYNFDEQGRITNVPGAEPEQPGQPVKNGIVAENGSLYYYVDNVLTYAGLVYIDGYYYYVRTSGELIYGCDYWISKTNGLMIEKSYTFDEQGRMVEKTAVEPEKPEQTEKKNGIVAEDGSLYYYVDGVRNYAGLIYIDGYYYYVNTQGEVKNNCTYWISKTNGLLAEKSYTFDAQGRITNP